MRVTDKEILKLFRGPGRCGYCNRWCREREAAHLYARQMSGGSTLNVRLNLIALGGPFDCACHVESHAGREPTLIDLLAKVAARENMLQDELKRILLLFKRAPKDSRPCSMCHGKGCVICHKAGIFDRWGEPWFEAPRRPTWAQT